jgi:hypothetical protein
MPAKAPNLALAAELGRLLEYSLLSYMPNDLQISCKRLQRSSVGPNDDLLANDAFDLAEQQI